MKERNHFWSHHSRERRGFRWWLHYGDWCLSTESYFASSMVSWGARFELGDCDHVVSTALHFWPFDLYVSLGIPWRFAKNVIRNREWQAVLHWPELVLRLSWGQDPMSWKRGDPSWSWYILDTFLGKVAYREDPTPVHFANEYVVMPEGRYRCHGKISRDSWKRPFWFRHTISRAHVDMDQHVPHPGKGENSYDCGEDGVFGMTCPANSIREALDTIAESAMRDRKKYGNGYAWRPEVARP